MVLVPGIGLVVAGLFALLFLLAWEHWRATIVNSLRIDLPFIGNVIASSVDALLSTTYAILVYYLDRLLTPVFNLVISPLFAVVNMVSGIYNAIASLYTTIAVTVVTTIPNATTHAMNYALGLVNYVQGQLAAAANDLAGRIVALQTLALAYADQQFQRALGLINYVQGQALAYADARFNQALAFVQSTAVNLTAYADHLYAQAITYALAQGEAAINYARSVAATAALDTAHALAAAEAYAETTAVHVATGLITDVEKGAAAVAAATWPGVIDGVIAIEGVIGLDLPDIGAAIRAIPRSVPFDIATALAGAFAISVPMLRYLEQCGIPNCKNLGALGRDLQALLALVGDAAFLAFVLEMIHEPEQAASTVESVFGGLLRTATSGARDLLSV